VDAINFEHEADCYLRTYDAKDRVPFSTVTNGLINYTVFLCRLLPCGIL